MFIQSKQLYFLIKKALDAIEAPCLAWIHFANGYKTKAHLRYYRKALHS
jgi:hypothetical protein